MCNSESFILGKSDLAFSHFHILLQWSQLQIQGFPLSGPKCSLSNKVKMADFVPFIGDLVLFD